MLYFCRDVPDQTMKSFKTLKHRRNQSGYSVFTIATASMEIKMEKEVIHSLHIHWKLRLFTFFVII